MHQCLPDRIARPDTTLLADTQRIIDQANSDIRAAPPPGPRGPLRKRREGHAAAPQREAAGPHLENGAGKHRRAPPRAAATTKHPPRRGLLTAQHPSAALLSQSGQPTRLRPAGGPAYAPLLSAAANTIATELAPGQIMHQEPGLAKPDSQRDPRIDFLDPSRPEASDMQRIQAHGATNPSTTDKYERYWNVFRHYCEANSWDPYVFSIELATLFAAFMSKRVNQKTAAPIASIDCYFSALNRYYLIRHDTQPWSHGRMAELKTAFKRAQTQKAGEMHLPNAGLRIAVPPAIVQNILDDASTARGQAMSPRSSRLDHSDSDLRLAWYAVFLLQLLFLFRADTIAGVVDAANQITISAGRLTFEVRRLKRGGANISPFTRSIPIPTNSSHPRARAATIIATALKLKTAQGQPLLGPALWGSTPSKVSDKISIAMETHLIKPCATGCTQPSGIPPESFISSHSWRKAGASAIATFADFLKLRRWGMWKSITAPILYIDDRYSVDPMMTALFDWIDQPVGLADIPERHQYTDSQCVDDGIDQQEIKKANKSDHISHALQRGH